MSKNIATLKFRSKVNQSHLKRYGYWCSIITISLRYTVFEIFDLENAVTLKTGFGVRQSAYDFY